MRTVRVRSPWPAAGEPARDDAVDRPVPGAAALLAWQRTAGNRAAGSALRAGVPPVGAPTAGRGAQRVAVQRQPPRDAGVDTVPAGVPDTGSGPAPEAGETDSAAGAGDGSAAREGRPGPATVTAPGPTGSGPATGSGPGGTAGPESATPPGPATDGGAATPAAAGQASTPAAPGQATGQTTAPSAPGQATGGVGPTPAGPAPVETTDVPRPPARPSIALPTRTPVVVAGAVPPATETMPDLGIDTTAEFWGVGDVGTYVTVLVEGWRQRRAAQGETIDVAATRASFVTDFDETMQGWYARSGSFRVPWAARERGGLRWLADERRRLRRAVTRERIDDGGRRRRLTQAEQDAWVEAGLVVSRLALVDRARSHLTEGAWGWMVERREHLDFVTITQRGVAALRGFAPTSAVDEVATVRAELARLGRALTDTERERALTRATDALRRRTRDRTAVLTPEQQAEAIADAESRKLGVPRARELIRTASIAVEQPGWVDVHARGPDGRPQWGPVWDPDSLGVMPQTATFVLRLIDAYGARFTASNYAGHGGGAFSGRGRSLDLSIPERSRTGFFEPNAAIRFALAIDRAAAAAGVGWRALYDDFSVARAVNEHLGQSRVVEIANTERNRAGEITNINWHGPLVNHFHLDLAF